MDEYSDAFDLIRSGLGWNQVEKEKGIYNFTDWDILLSYEKQYNIQPYFRLGNSNSLYNNGFPPNTTDSINAFVNYAKAALEHFYDNGIIWELWNEPNNPQNWPPQPNATAYGVLAMAVGNMIRENESYCDEIFVGPAVGHIPMDYINETFEVGVLKYFDAISVHPFRPGGPESVVSDYAVLRQSIDYYNPDQSNYIPIIGGPWGWQTCYENGVPIKCNNGANTGVNSYLDQANYIVRQFIINPLENVPISIFYDWKNAGNNSTEAADNSGVVEYLYHNSTYPFTQKLSYKSAYYFKKFISSNGFNVNNFSKINCYCLDNTNECENKYVWCVQIGGNNVVIWYAPDNTTANINNGVNVNVNISYSENGCFNVFSMFGIEYSSMCSNNNGNSVTVKNVTQSVLYLLNYK